MLLLGLDPSQYQNQRTRSIYTDSIEETAIDLDDETRYDNCNKLDKLKFNIIHIIYWIY